MCLVINKKQTEELKNSGQEFVTRYKVLIKINGKCLSVYQGFVWKQGWNIAKKAAPNLLPISNQVFDGALHVFINEKDAQEFIIIIASDKYFITPVKCYLKDLIAVGTFELNYHVAAGNFGAYSSETYTQVYVEELPCA